MERARPPFRADHVGSLLRPAALKAAREKRARDEISADALTAAEDREIEALIEKQEAIGLKAVTDGEFRRRSWNFDFLGAPAGRGMLSRRAQDKIQRAGPAAATLFAARHRQTWRGGAASDGRAFPFF